MQSSVRLQGRTLRRQSAVRLQTRKWGLQMQVQSQVPLRLQVPMQSKVPQQGATLPRGFWRHFVEDELHHHYSNRQRLKCYGAVQKLIRHTSQGERSWTAMRDGADRNAKRRRGGEYNATKARRLGFSLLPFVCRLFLSAEK